MKRLRTMKKLILNWRPSPLKPGYWFVALHYTGDILAIARSRKKVNEKVATHWGIQRVRIAPVKAKGRRQK